jgi:hypothetical protein
MQRFHVVTVDDTEGDLDPLDIERIEAGVARLRILLDSPIALLGRAQELLEGTAERLF